MQVVPKMIHQARPAPLQGNVKTAVNNLFLFPGPFGTPKVFELIPSIDPNFVAVFVLTSAFANVPDQFNNASIPELASLYVAEIKSRQPHGPYSLLGYSVGGTIAYEVARQLLADKEAVERIYFVDSPCPLIIPSIPRNFMDFIGSSQADQQELDSQSKARVRLMSSVDGTPTLGSLERYRPTPLLPYPGHPIPGTTYYVAKQSLDPHMAVNLPNPLEGDERLMLWLLYDRRGLEATGGGWERLVDRSKLKIVSIDGNHLSIMEEPNVRDRQSV